MPATRAANRAHPGLMRWQRLSCPSLARWPLAGVIALCALALASRAQITNLPSLGLESTASAPLPAASRWWAANPDAPAANPLRELLVTPEPASTNANRSMADFQMQLEAGRRHQEAGRRDEAETCYASVVQGPAPEALQRAALLGLGQVAFERNDLPRAQQILAQWLARWPHDPGVPEIVLRQGLLYRQMGLPNLAISKFYAVMTSALVLKPERFDFYQQLVLRAQNEIALTQFELGHYSEASEAFRRLLKLDSPPANRAALQYRLIACLSALDRSEEAITQGQDFLARFPEAPERAEVHFLCATALKKQRRSEEALRQVLALLREERSGSTNASTTLSYWQRKAGNEIANQFYQEGDALKALDIYASLASLDTSAEWQLPAWYQLGLVYERLEQPAKASEYYDKILGRKAEVAESAPPSLKSIIEMARWRKDFLAWQIKTQTASLELRAGFSAGSKNGPSSASGGQ